MVLTNLIFASIEAEVWWTNILKECPESFNCPILVVAKIWKVRIHLGGQLNIGKISYFIRLGNMWETSHISWQFDELGKNFIAEFDMFLYTNQFLCITKHQAKGQVSFF